MVDVDGDSISDEVLHCLLVYTETAANQPLFARLLEKILTCYSMRCLNMRLIAMWRLWLVIGVT